MRTWALVVLVASASLGAAQPDERVKKAADALQGEWVVEAAEFGPMKGALSELKGRKATIQGDRFDSPMGPGKGKRTFKVDPSKSPAAIDLYEGGTLVSRGLYALDGDKLTMCLGMTIGVYGSPTAGEQPTKLVADERPTRLDPGQGLLLVMRRAK